jgi:YVTN family beta-propeller protein
MVMTIGFTAACSQEAGLTPTSTTTRSELSSNVSTTEPAVTTVLSTTTTLTTTTTLPPITTTTTLVPADGLQAHERKLTPVTTIGGNISPKSVVASGDGLFVAQNMMYRHTITVYDRSHQLLETISDRVAPEAFGHEDFPGEYSGSPVEAAFTSDGSHVYVSNYRMYGGGLSTAASDGCNQGDWPDSFVYRIDTETLKIDQLVRVGPVPKFLAVSPDDRYLVVANWCGFDVSIVEISTGTEVARIPVGRHPRGVAISPDSSTAYVAVMGSRDIATIDLRSHEVAHIEDVGANPRHLVISPDGHTLYVSLNGEGRLAKLDLATGDVLAKVATGAAPRSMAMSEDGTALYVVNYHSDTVSKVRTSDMVELEELVTNVNPIGVTYDAPTRQIWVSNYSGTIQVFQDVAP